MMSFALTLWNLIYIFPFNLEFFLNIPPQMFWNPLDNTLEGLLKIQQTALQ
jgi:hypothetical protein